MTTTQILVWVLGGVVFITWVLLAKTKLPKPPKRPDPPKPKSPDDFDVLLDEYMIYDPNLDGKV